MTQSRYEDFQKDQIDYIFLKYEGHRLTVHAEVPQIGCSCKESDVNLRELPDNHIFPMVCLRSCRKSSSQSKYF